MTLEKVYILHIDTTAYRKASSAIGIIQSDYGKKLTPTMLVIAIAGLFVSAQFHLSAAVKVAGDVDKNNISNLHLQIPKVNKPPVRQYSAVVSRQLAVDQEKTAIYLKKVLEKRHKGKGTLGQEDTGLSGRDLLNLSICIQFMQ